MRAYYLAAASVMMTALCFLAQCSAVSEDNGVGFDEFSLGIGDRIEIGEYSAELVQIQSLRDGIVLIRVSKGDGRFDEQRVLLMNSANSFDGGADDGGITITVTDIFDEESGKIRIEYPKSLGTPRKRANEAGRVVKAIPNLIIEKSFEKNEINMGDDVKVTVMVKNTGTDPAQKIQVSDQPPQAEFVYVAGYPPKIKNQLEPGESDSAIYVVTAIKEGQVKIAPIEVVYSDAKNKIRSNRSDPSEVIILPPRKPEIDIRIDPIPPINPGGSSFVNVTIENNGQAAATLVDVKLEGRPDGLEIATPTTSYDRILPGSKETFSTEVKGNRGGNFTVIAEARYKVGSEAETKKAMGTAAVLEQEYKYLYYLLIIPVLIIGFWIYRRYREYKY